MNKQFLVVNHLFMDFLTKYKYSPTKNVESEKATQRSNGVKTRPFLITTPRLFCTALPQDRAVCLMLIVEFTHHWRCH